MNKILTDKIEEIRALCNAYEVRSLFAFGSVCSEHFSETSDIDFLLSFKPDIDIKNYTDNYFELHEKLENLFKRKIDLVTDKSLSNPYFIKSIERSKQLLYAA